MWLKGWMFLLIGTVSFTLLLLKTPSLRNGALLCLTVRAFCRAYYFAFYMIQHHVDGEFHHAGLADSVKRRLMKRKR